MTRRKKPRTDADMGFDNGRPFMLGDDARAEHNKIVHDPNMELVLAITRVEDRFAVSIPGEPSQEILDLLEHIVDTYRQTLAAWQEREKPQ